MSRGKIVFPLLIALILAILLGHTFLKESDTRKAADIEPVAQEPATLEKALALYSTPFIDDYRARYDVNENKMVLILRMQDNCEHFKEAFNFTLPCTERDVENLKKLAQWGDMASLRIVPWLIKDAELQQQAFKQAADMGEIDSMLTYAGIIAEKDPELSKRYIEAAKARGYVSTYGSTSEWYVTRGLLDEYCPTMKEGYQKFGLTFLKASLLGSQIKSDPYLARCLGETEEEFLKKEGTYEAKLILGYMYVKWNKNAEAKELFQEIYENSDDAEITLNAGFCLGMMYYSGTAVERDIEYGLRLIQESVDGGYTMIFHIPDIQMMPAEYRITTYANFCEVLID